MRFIRNDSYTFANSYTTATPTARGCPASAGATRPAAPARRRPTAARLARGRRRRAVGLRRFVDPAARRHQPDERRATTTRSTAACCRTATPVARVYGANEYELYAQDSWQRARQPDRDRRPALWPVLAALGGERPAGGAQREHRRVVRPARREHAGRHPVERRAERSRSSRPARSTTARASTSGTRTTSRRASRRRGRRKPTLVGGDGGWLRRLSSTTASVPASPRRSTTADRSACRTSSTRRSAGTARRRPSVRFTGIDNDPGDATPTRRRAASRRRRRSAPAPSRRASTVDPDAVLARLQRHRRQGARARATAIEVGYVGRRGRNLLVRRDLAMPLNLTDPKSGVDYFTAARQLIDAYTAAGGDVSQIGPASRTGRTCSPTRRSTASRRRRTWRPSSAACSPTPSPRSTTPTSSAPRPAAASGRSPTSPSSTTRWRRRARSGGREYNAMQLTFRQRYSNGYQFDLNYTLARGKDHGSEVERGSAFDNFGAGGYSGFLVNSFDPDLNYSYSDFDVRHQINVNWLASCRSARARSSGGAHGSINAIIGDWSIAGHRPVDERLPVQRASTAGRAGRRTGTCRATRRWRTPGVLPRDAARRRDAVGGQPSPFADPVDGAGGVPGPVSGRRRASATCCAATATSRSTRASARRGSCRADAAAASSAGTSSTSPTRRSSTRVT